MNAFLAFEKTIDVLAADLDGRALKTGFFALLIRENLPLEVMRFGVAVIHPEKHVRPIVGFGSASAWMNVEGAVEMVVLSSEEEVDS